MPQNHQIIPISILECDQQNQKNVLSDFKWPGHTCLLMVGQQRHTNVHWPCWRRPHEHYFSITKKLSERLCTRCNKVCWRSGWSSCTGDQSRMGFGFSGLQKKVDLWLRNDTVLVLRVKGEVQRNGVETKKNSDKFSNCDSYVTSAHVRCFW